MKLIAGVDIGNSTTEVCIAGVKDDNTMEFLSSSLTATTGVKGTVDNVTGIINGLTEALKKIDKNISDLSIIRINEAAPVVCGAAMETITETVITGSTMIGHNPSTPGGVGLGVGEIIHIKDLPDALKEKSYIVVIPKEIGYEEASRIINMSFENDIDVKAAIVQNDEAVLINNRLKKIIPIVDEVRQIEKIPSGVVAAVEVAPEGKSISTLSNPYGIATIFDLTSEETKYVIPISKSLIGKKSAVVIKTPKGQVKERIIPAGNLLIIGPAMSSKVSVDSGAEMIMESVEEVGTIDDVEGEENTNVGNMIKNLKSKMANITGQKADKIKIKDIFAVDTTVPVKAEGGLAGETSMEKAVVLAAMVKTDTLPMIEIAEKLQRELGVFVKIAGVEAVMAALGALTTPGTKLPLAILDIGGGSTDAALIDEKGIVKSIHMAGAGELVTMLIDSELGLNDRYISEEIKKNPIGKVESLFHIRMENREIKFFDRPLNPRFYGRIVILKENEMIPIFKEDLTMEKIISIRRQAKHKVFVKNTVRALMKIAPENNLRNIPNVVLVGGSALDFEIPEMILTELSNHKIVAGKGNIRRTEGPRNAVATGLVMSYIG
ncbi:diol dehydratase reactivase subunit alpha [Thermoanaerobacterium thermosaccharolyticum]|uniref:diol dehydratase reactivase subunit alpha n=1 Tax=Thermoanaerobacterium thermosaccharolyticum TaxID=1517 RepID=UPI000C07C014|nr:diol dehydratase reactivase subunit alpha [Thermoanaerobacterium thermosaccharolyticum]PHO07209.1 diol dehydratase reactivase subunit alpha [Thermoanaerobacterium thermosaccharolyticum]